MLDCNCHAAWQRCFGCCCCFALWLRKRGSWSVTPMSCQSLHICHASNYCSFSQDWKMAHVTWITWARRRIITIAPFITTSTSAAAPTDEFRLITALAKTQKLVYDAFVIERLHLLLKTTCTRVDNTRNFEKSAWRIIVALVALLALYRMSETQFSALAWSMNVNEAFSSLFEELDALDHLDENFDEKLAEYKEASIPMIKALRQFVWNEWMPGVIIARLPTCSA